MQKRVFQLNGNIYDNMQTTLVVGFVRCHRIPDVSADTVKEMILINQHAVFVVV